MTDQPEEQPGIAAAIIAHEGRVLMVRRRLSEGELLWQFPAGGIESGETAEQAAVREAGEETGVTAAAISVLGRRVHPKTGREMSYVACELVDGEAHVADADELDQVEWVTLDDIPARVPYGLYGPVQEWLDTKLTR